MESKQLRYQLPGMMEDRMTTWLHSLPWLPSAAPAWVEQAPMMPWLEEALPQRCEVGRGDRGKLE